MFKLSWLALFALAAVFGGILSYQAAGFGEPESFPELQSFSLPDTQGLSHRIDEWKGRVLVINFWATWCPPCLEEIPLFMKLQDSYGKQGLQIIGIAVDDTEAVEKFNAKLQINYPNLVAGLSGLGLSTALGNPSGVVPYSVVVNREGRIVHTHPGFLDLAKIRKSVIPLL